MFKQFLPVAALLGLWALLALYTMVRGGVWNRWVKVAAIPLGLLAALQAYQVQDFTAGYAKETSSLPDRVQYLGHVVVLNGRSERQRLEVWTRNGRTTRLLSVPYSKPLEQVLQEASKRRQQGRDVELRKRPSGGQSEHDGAPYESHDLEPSASPKGEPPEPQSPTAPQQPPRTRPINPSV